MTTRIERALARKPAAQADRARTLAQRFAARAADGGEARVSYAALPSPLGDLLVARTARGLVRIAFEREDPDAVLDVLARRVSPAIVEAPGALDAERRQLDDYFAARRHAFDLALDWQLAGQGFTRRALRATARIPYGDSATYREIAARAGNAAAVRAAGNAVGSNPLPIVIPCHRVLRSGGGLGGYGGGLERKRALLRLEGLDLPSVGA